MRRRGRKAARRRPLQTKYRAFAGGALAGLLQEVGSNIHSRNARPAARQRDGQIAGAARQVQHVRAGRQMEPADKGFGFANVALGDLAEVACHPSVAHGLLEVVHIERGSHDPGTLRRNSCHSVSSEHARERPPHVLNPLWQNAR